MANTINSTTDAELTRSLLDGSIEGTFEDDTITSLTRENLFSGCNSLTKVSLPNVTTMNGYSFTSGSESTSLCASLETIDVPNLATFSGTLFRLSALKYFNAPNLTTHSSSSNSVFQNCTTLEKVNLPKLTRYRSISNTSLKYVVLPSIIDFCTVRGSSSLIALDLGETCTNLNVGGDNIFYQTYADNIEAFIIRSETLLPLTRLLHTDVPESKRFGKFTKNKIYAPQALLEDYKVATNWSNYADCFEPIEGSKYEHYWADGTPIGLSNGSGLIAYYDVGNADDWDSETNTIASTVDNEFTTYGIQNNVFQHSIPTIYYNNYCSGNGFIDINLGSILSDISNSITIEWLEASSYVYLFPALTGYMNSNRQWSAGSLDTSGTNRIFHHFVLVLNNSNAELYCNGQLYKNSSITNALNINRLVVGSTNYNLYLGPVSVWNRALTQEEITQHYNYYVDTAMVGQTAFDSNGNFIAE